MATVKAPLLSLDASGTIGGAFVYSKWKGINYVRRHAIPTNPRAATQVSVRAIFRALTQAWAGLAAGVQASWADLVAGEAMSNFNAYVGHNQDRWRSGQPIADEYPYTGAGTAPAAPTTTPTGGVRHVSLSIADGADPGDFWMLCKGTTGFTPSWANCIAVVPRTATPTLYVDSPLDPATYYYRIRGIAWDAAYGAFEAEVSGTAT